MRRKAGCVIVTRDGLPQTVVEREDLDAVADALGKDIELADENIGGLRELAFALVADVVLDHAVAEKRGQHLHAHQRGDQEQDQAPAERHRRLNSRRGGSMCARAREAGAWSGLRRPGRCR
jgi:hypothetical protein